MAANPEAFRTGYSLGRVSTSLSHRWSAWWLRFAGTGPLGRLAAGLAAWPAPPHKARIYLSGFHPQGYISPRAIVHHPDLHLGPHPFVDDGAVIFQRPGGGALTAGRALRVFRHGILETGFGGALSLGEGCSIHPRCQINAYVADVHIGDDVMLAPNCAVYSYNHGIAPGRPISRQPLVTRGEVVIGDGAWLGVGAIVLSGVSIGEGAVVGAGAVVTKDIPAHAVAGGNPARVLKYRDEIAE